MTNTLPVHTSVQDLALIHSGTELIQSYGKLGTCYLSMPPQKPSTEVIMQELEQVLIANIDSGTQELKEACNLLGLAQYLLIAH